MHKDSVKVRNTDIEIVCTEW